MDIINNYEVINYKANDEDKYTGNNYYQDCTVHYLNQQIHREDDLPAIYSFQGDVVPDEGLHYIKYYKFGKLHRDNNKPAVICFTDGKIDEQEWYVNGELHNDNDEPAHFIIRPDYYDNYEHIGSYNWQTEKYEDGEDYEGIPDYEYDCELSEWYQKGQLHRDNDQPAFMQFGYEERGYVYKWFQNGELHRDNDKPAFITNNSMFWVKNGESFRQGHKPFTISMFDYHQLCLSYANKNEKLKCESEKVWRWLLYKYVDSPTTDNLCGIYSEHDFYSEPKQPLIYLKDHFKAKPIVLHI